MTRAERNGNEAERQKSEILENKVTVDRIGNHVSQIVPVATMWAYFWHLYGDEVFAAARVNVTENVLFQISYWANITTAHVIRFRGVLYNMTRVDVFEGYRGDIMVYCERQNGRNDRRNIMIA